MRFTILDQISDPGTPGKPNDDALCFADGMAAVFDGATGIGERLIFPDLGSDAAWLAHMAAQRFGELSADLACDAMVRQVCCEARDAVSAIEDLSVLPRHAWPTSGFEMVRLTGNSLELSGLGDCGAYVVEPDGTLATHSAMPSSRELEMAAARRMLDAAGGFGPNGGIVREGATLAALRRGRDRHNTPGGNVWTLGMVPEAADHVSCLRLAARPGTLVLLMSDGFAALCEAYQRHDAAGFVHAAHHRGLSALVEELRLVERVEDPMPQRFARFKRCDDATAILALLEA